MLKAALSGFIDFLYPKSADVYALESLSPGELITKLPPATDLGVDTIAVFAYADGRVRDLIWELKYRRNNKIAESLASILYDVIKTELAERMLFDNFASPLLIPMPMSSERRRERGWNQTEILCEEVVRLDGEKLFEYKPDILEKSHHTESQTLTENKKERLKNLENTMSASDSAKGRNIILLDDVTTTGATFREARRALKTAWAGKILCIAIAH